MSESVNPTARGRVAIIDIARALAIVAMAIYHFTWDLEHFSYVEEGLTGHGGWRIFARCIASSFLFLVGFSLVLAHGREIRWRKFLVRLGQICAGALAVTVATLFATPNSFVFFGILHHIALASLLGLAFLRLPALLTAACGIVVVAAPSFVTLPGFDSRWLAWIGWFSDKMPLSNDLVPIFPFFGAVLIGIAAGRIAVDRGLIAIMRGWNDRLARLRPLEFAGRHALIIYLLHQPLLYGLVASFALIAPPDRDAIFAGDCNKACLASQDAAFCAKYCGCAEKRLKEDGLFDALMKNDAGEGEMTRIRQITTACSFEAGQ
ncbi:heparan-alpha-glucosaminide N-acetyltransferase [Jiella endophytica]|uniref:heparan-alpha-glucosaminide N-acetyltransferase n=1 Tax=Jiella endophytica TaxID=2558362 RepID=UPI001FDF4F87|nr:heparan-alpha-glucosaminide N-acetyltransferase [Jiella endophytica]